MALMTTLAVGSALVSAYGNYQSSKAQANALRGQAELNFLKANEIRERNEINNELLMESALVFTGTQKAQLAGAGRTIESGRSVVAETISKASRQVELNTRAAEWEARMVEIGADSQLASADQVETAGTISAIGTAGFGTARAFISSPGTEGVTAGGTSGSASDLTGNIGGSGRVNLSKGF